MNTLSANPLKWNFGTCKKEQRPHLENEHHICHEWRNEGAEMSDTNSYFVVIKAIFYFFGAFVSTAMGIIHLRSIAPEFSGRKFWMFLFLGIGLLSAGITFTLLACRSIISL